MQINIMNFIVISFMVISFIVQQLISIGENSSSICRL